MSGRESTTEIPEKPDRKPKVKWPKASDKEAWGSFDECLYTTLQSSLRGSIMAKPNSFGHIINEEGGKDLDIFLRGGLFLGRAVDGRDKSSSF